MKSPSGSEPAFSSEPHGDGLRFTLTGAWTIDGSEELEHAGRYLVSEATGMRDIFVDLDQIKRLDTAGAWVIERSRDALARRGAALTYETTRAEFKMLLEEAKYVECPPPRHSHGSVMINMLADIGETLVNVGRNMFNGVSFLGEVVHSMVKAILHPARFRGTAIVFHIESFALRSMPIIVLINFLVGCIVAQQSIFQLQKFGAATFAVDLIGILALRELAVLLTSIMIAGRSGSAITAELGSMKMREEIDALRVMGMDPVDVLIMPRILALLISLPLLTFMADMAAIFGALVVGWIYGGISPEVFLGRLQSAIALNTFLVGLIKAPFMALVIGMIAAMEGLATQGSAESLGRQVTSSVVKSIFMVIVVDGLFAMFFASIRY
jgi:phospholipid/cholesterol/gamma-HCH transport system permease protein